MRQRARPARPSRRAHHARARQRSRHPSRGQLRPASAPVRVGGGCDHGRPDAVEDPAGHQEHLLLLDGPAGRRRSGGGVRPGRDGARPRSGRRASALVMGGRAVGLRHVAVGRPGGRAHRPGQQPRPADWAGRRHRRGPVVAAPARPGPARRPGRHRGRRAGHGHRHGCPAGGQPGRRRDPLAAHHRRLACPHRGQPGGDLRRERPPDRLRRPDRPAALDDGRRARAAGHRAGRRPRPGRRATRKAPASRPP